MSNVFITAEEVSHYNNLSYKIFYGKWKATKIIEDPRKQGIKADKNISNLIGTEITMLPEKVIVGNEVVTNYPMYQISIIPIFSETQAYIKDLPPINEVNIKGNFFAFVDVEDFYEVLNSDFPFNSFYVVDDETLVAEQDGYYVELKCIEYIDDVEYRIEFL